MTCMPSTSTPPDDSPPLIRGMGLWSATALNMIDMIGVGPFITMPLVLSAMGGPQALLGWILGAMLAVCDGLVTAELSASLPGSGGSYRYLRESYGSERWGRLISFLFIWQVSFSASLSIATGCIGLAGYAAYYWPKLETVVAHHQAALHIPWVGAFQVSWIVTPGTVVAVLICFFTVLLLYRRITAISRLSKILWFGAAMLVATYDYWGYYNVAFLGDEIKEPEKNIPRALLLSILLVACLYLMMNVCILAVIPWREMLQAGQNNTGLYVVSLFMERLYGAWAARLVTGLVIATAFASVFSLMLGYSRVPYAAAKDGNYFKVFAKVHPEFRFPHISLLALGVVAAAFCFLRLKDAIAALVVIRLILQFLVQAVGLIVLRIRRPDLPRPFRMWLYPLPALLASAGFLYILFGRPNWQKEVRYAALILLTGVMIYMVRAWKQSEWPFAATAVKALAKP